MEFGMERGAGFPQTKANTNRKRKSSVKKKKGIYVVFQSKNRMIKSFTFKTYFSIGSVSLYV